MPSTFVRSPTTENDELSALELTRPASPSPVGRADAEEVLAIPLCFRLPNRYARIYLLVRIAILVSNDGRFVQAKITCDEHSAIFPRDGSTAYFANLPHVTVYAHENLFAAPMYVVIEKLRGVRLAKRLVVQLAFMEWLPGDASTFEILADAQLMEPPTCCETRVLYVGTDGDALVDE
ncbi:hypothetical protein OH77DRAFT_107970 [Trametes cingulata]|nr:hypothetical protein OH77DRAFT_107970 [Trametes cingulata]